MKFKTTRLDDDNCPKCGYNLSAATSDVGATPEPGDYSICIECYAFLRFDDNLKLIALTEEELDELPQEIFMVLIDARCKLQVSKGQIHAKNPKTNYRSP
jgi:hypothetical protein